MTHLPKLGRGRDRSRTEVAIRMEAPPERVFDALVDAWLLPVWGVGAPHIRDGGDNWPEAGSVVHHQVGAWPFTISDVTAVVECEAPRRLALQGSGSPYGEGRTGPGRA